MKYKTIALTFLLAIGFSISFQNCDIDDETSCNCPTLLGEYFDIQEIELEHYVRVGDCCQIEVQSGESVAFDDYNNITLQFLVDYHSSIEETPEPHQHWNFSLMNSALACTCIENGFRGSQEEVLENLSIITLNDFDDQYAANDTITDLFKIKSLNDSEAIEISEFLNRDTLTIMSQYLFLELQKAPEASEDFQVKVNVDLSTDESYEVESKAIKITE